MLGPFLSSESVLNFLVLESPETFTILTLKLELELLVFVVVVMVFLVTVVPTITESPSFCAKQLLDSNTKEDKQKAKINLILFNV